MQCKGSINVSRDDDVANDDDYKEIRGFSKDQQQREDLK